ncbi:MAG: hypothetical protein QW666_00255 [Candidatus Woesearchaeota archaeon]
MVVLEEAIKFMEHLGVWNVVIPFLLVFTLVYAILDKTKVFGTEDGKPKHRINAMIALVLAFMVLISVTVLEVINIIARYIVIAVVGMMFFAVIIGILGVKELKKNLVLALGLIALGGLVLYLLGYFSVINMYALRTFFEGPIIAVIIMILLIFLIMRKPKEEKKPEPTPPHPY